MKRIVYFLPLFCLAACDGNREDKGKTLAKINGTSYTQGDFEFMLKTQTADRQDELIKDPEARRKQFNFMLKQKLQAMAAQKSKYGKDAAINKRQTLIDQRIVTQYYYQTFLGENDGRSVKEIEDYYKANAAKFSDDSGRVKPFSEVRPRAADSLLLASAPLDSFFKANAKHYEEKAHCEVYFIKTANRKAADEAYKAIGGGMAFSDAVDKYTIHNESKPNHGKVGRLLQGEALWELGSLNGDSVFFNEDTRLKPGAVSKPIKKDSTWMLVKSDSCVPQHIPTLDQVRRQVSEDYLSGVKSKLNDNALVDLKRKYNVKMVGQEEQAGEADLQKYYESHKDNYMTSEGYEVYHIEGKNKDQLARRVKAVKDLEGFKKLAAQSSENAWTKPAQGLVGAIKKDFCLPYGIGMMPALFPILDSLKDSGLVAPLENPEARRWHAFWLAKKLPKQVKPFDRAKALVKEDFKSEKTKTVKTDDTLATYAKGKVIREKDVMFLREEIPASMQERYTREALVDYLLTWDLATAESEAMGLADDIKLQAQRMENKINFWAQLYQDSIVSRNAGMDTTDLKKVFRENRPYFTKDSTDNDWHKYVRDIAGFMALDQKDFDIEYKTNPERYRRDTIPLSFDDARFEVFQNLKGAGYTKAEDRLLDRLEREFQVVILDSSLLPPKIGNATETYKVAQNLHYDRKLDQALEMYQRLRDQFPKMEGLQDSVCFGMAQIYIEQEKYQQALSEYRRLSYLYPKSPNNYKAMFMVGFIHAEHLKNDSAAVRAFEKMLAQYPSSDLSDDADWMIRNIRSGGKLMPVLEGDSGYVAPDSSKAKKAAAAK
jgi:hypothetical protein